ncbi:MAG TPA: hypothetical protein VGH28_19000 [Polyangiaceae bacterium]
MTGRPIFVCIVLFQACGGAPPTVQTVAMYGPDAAAPDAAPRDIGCAIRFDREEMNHMAALDECLGEPRKACWAGCEATCTSCGVACAGDSACEAQCIAERDTCKSNHCVDVHARCRNDLVRDWLTNRCDDLCGPYRDCIEDCAANPSDDCPKKCEATATAACNPVRCDALRDAPERKTLDPRWRANDCDRVCTKVWECARAQCDATAGCDEPVKTYRACIARMPSARACGLDESPGLCPQP